MKRGVLIIALGVQLCGSICPVSHSQAQARDDPVAELAKKLADRFVAKKQNRVTVLDFTDIQNRPNELGRYLALQLANELVNLAEVSVLDRANLETVMAEHKLTADGLLKPEEAKKLGQFAGVEAFVIGNVALMGEQVEIMVRAISTESSEIVASGKASLQATKEFRRMLGLSVDSATTGSLGAGTGAAAPEGASIATRGVGPITAALRSVAEHSMQTERGAIPAIRCAFELENRDLRRSVAIAANQRTRDNNMGVQVAGYRGGLADSNRMAWTLIDVKGISAVVCFDVRTGWHCQQNPGGVVDYIRTGRKHEGQRLRADHRGTDDGRYWSGSFSSIPPGQKIRMTVDFIPATLPDRRDGSSHAFDSPPAYFQFDMELVLGTYAEGEDPVKAKDLMLRNITIDRVVLAAQPTDSGP